MKREYVIETSPDKDSPAKSTTVVVDFDGVTLDDLVDAFFASTSPRVKLQARLRSKGIPDRIEVTARELLPGRTRTAAPRPMTVEELQKAAESGTLTPEQARQALAAIQAVLARMEPSGKRK